jgi:hypothetical protein
VILVSPVKSESINFLIISLSVETYQFGEPRYDPASRSSVLAMPA